MRVTTAAFRREGARTAAGNVLAIRRLHATNREQLAELPGAVGWFDLEDIAFDAESGCVVVPFRVLDEDAIVVETPPGLIRRLLRRSGDRYAAWRRWLFLIHGAVGLEIEEGAFPELRPCDFLQVDYDPEDSTVDIYCDGSWDVVSAKVERIDVVVEETPERVGWGLVYPRVGDYILGGDGFVFATPPRGWRRIDPGSGAGSGVIAGQWRFPSRDRARQRLHSPRGYLGDSPSE